MTTYVLNSLRHHLAHAAHANGVYFGWLIRRCTLLLSFLAACSVWAGSRVSLMLVPMSTRVWVKRRVRVINRMHTTRVVGFLIALIGLVMVWLSILFKVLLDPVPYIEPPQAIESKDDALRITLEAQHLPAALDKPMPSVEDLVKSYRRHWGASIKRGHTRLNDAPAAHAVIQQSAWLSKQTAQTQQAGVLNGVPIVLKDRTVVAVQAAEAPVIAAIGAPQPAGIKPIMTVAQNQSPARMERCSEEFFIIRWSCELRECQKPENSGLAYCSQVNQRYPTEPVSSH